MSIKKLSFMLLSALSLAALMNGCGSSSKEGISSPGGVARVADEATCRHCHASTLDPVSKTGIVQDFIGTQSATNPTGAPASIHFQLPDGTLNEEAGCQGCHGGGAEHNGVGPLPFPNPIAVNRCNAAECHNGKVEAGFKATDFATDCNSCHKGNGAIHSIGFATPPGSPYTTQELYNDCVKCHEVPQAQHSPTMVNDNNGVRAITGEFAKWSHHVTGVSLDKAHCTACHLEGTVKTDPASGVSSIVVDRKYHMVDNKTHLRNADSDADMQWDPATPNHTTMDTFCMSCHDANGATSPVSVKIQAYINGNNKNAVGKTASASNPFGDTISNRYDKMQRPAVVDASSQFNTTNNSHHAVKGPRYSGRTRTAGARQIASAATFAQNSSALLQGARSTIYDAGNFNALYTPLENAGGEAAPRTGAASLGDDSTLHCGDCHTVGQWKPASSETANGSPTPAVIGAHGSNNEYLLRNSIGTDERHTQNAFVVNAGIVTYTNPNGAFLVCYNCHVYSKYGSVFLQTGVLGGHVGEYDQTGRCNGIGNTIPFNGYTTGKATDGTQFVSRFGGSAGTPATTVGGTPTALQYTSPAPYAGEQIADFGNVFGIQCANCHNSGSGNAYGGIHGSAKNQTLPGYTNDPSVKGGSYIDGAGNTTKIVRFLPGLGDANHVPGTLGGVTGGSTATFLRYSANAAKTVYTSLPVRSNITNTGVAPGKLGSYTYQTGGVTNDTNWEQKHWQQAAGTVINTVSGAVTGGTAASSGAGCYTLGNAAENSVGWPEAQQGKVDQNGNVIAVRPAVNEGLTGPSQGVAGQSSPLLFDNWGGCDDHGAPVGGGNHGFVKKIVRPVTY